MILGPPVIDGPLPFGGDDLIGYPDAKPITADGLTPETPKDPGQPPSPEGPEG